MAAGSEVYEPLDVATQADTEPPTGQAVESELEDSSLPPNEVQARPPAKPDAASIADKPEPETTEEQASVPPPLKTPADPEELPTTTAPPESAIRGALAPPIPGQAARIVGMRGGTESDAPDAAPSTLVLRLHLVRGEHDRVGKCRIIIDSDEAGTELYRIESQELVQGKLDIEVPAEVSQNARIARIYFLDSAETETGEGLYLTIAPEPDLSKPSQLARVLHALGFYDKAPFASDTPDPSQTLELEMAFARYQRVSGDTVSSFSDPDRAALEGLKNAYREYQYSPGRLTDTL